MERLLTPEQVADILQFNPETVRRMLREGRLPGIKVGDSWRTSEFELHKFLYLQQSKMPNGDHPDSEHNSN